MSEHFIRLGMSQDMQRQINDWRVQNADAETGKMLSFSEACRKLIQGGLDE